jgi:hypothetical protein
LKNIFKHILLFLTLFVYQIGFGQSDTLDKVLKPRIGVGTGILAYFGEVQNYQIGLSPTVNRIGGSVYINAPLSRSFNLEFSGMYGKIGANERSLTRNLNFESRIRSGSIILYYNFNPLFKGVHSYFTPIIGVGFSSFEFLSKTDLYDANGNMYHYWSDGSIMSLSEFDPNASTAVPMYRDYTYETDLREQNYDSLGKYREQSFAIPITIGGEWHLTSRVDFRLSTTLNYTFTDLIDNISPAGQGVRQGDDKKDYFMYTSASISYDLEFNSKLKDNNVDPFDQADELAEFDQSDLDQDGVIDALDDCPNTPIEALVDENGCPLDTDGDGVADYFDEEPDTPEGNYVDQYGITITDAQFRRQQELFNDTTGIKHDFDENFKKVTFTNKDGKEVVTGSRKDQNKPKSYVVIIGKEHKDITANELHKYLGYNDFQTVTKGDTVYYVLGEYDNIQDAVAAKTNLEDKGIKVDVIGKSNHDDSKLIEIDGATVGKIEKINIANGYEAPEMNKPDQVYRVQVGAFKNKIDADKLFPKISSLVYATGEDGITRYYTGNFDSYEDAEAYKKTLTKNGYQNSFVVAYKDHERVTLKEAGVDLPANYSEEQELNTFVEPRVDNSTNTSNSGIDMSKVEYRVLLGKFDGAIPVETIDVYMTIGGIKPVKNDDGSTSYYSKNATSENEANNMLNDYKTYGIQNMEVIYEYKGQFYTKSEFMKLSE